MIDVNQALLTSIGQLNSAADKLSGTLSQFGVEDEGVLVKRGINKNGGIATQLTKELDRSVSAGRALGVATGGIL